MIRTHYCNALNKDLIHQIVQVAGWVNASRDHGGIIFLDLRDGTGFLQVVFNPEQEVLFKQAQQLRDEYVISIKGKVSLRPPGTGNIQQGGTGEIELQVAELHVLNTALPLPFSIHDYDDLANEETRLQYRYLDLRRPDRRDHFVFRSRITHFIRRFFEKNGFLDIETPVLTKATPEGARDYLVPSRVHPGKFYALPQSPQLFKQLLMVSGFERYYQIVRCFRDEDLRADRQPEFTQIDMEMSFCDETDIQTLTEELICSLFKEFLAISLPQPFPRLSYQKAMQDYGSDKPDLRNPLLLVDITDLAKETNLKIFLDATGDKEGRVAALRFPQGACLARKAIEDYTAYVTRFGAKGLAYIKVIDRESIDRTKGLQSPLLKFIPSSTLEAMLERVQAQTGDIIFFGAGKVEIVNESLGALRIKLGDDFKLVKEGYFPLWVVDFPLLEFDKEGKRWKALHHPFTAPQGSDLAVLQATPGLQRSRAYDIVLNGCELGGGSIRIHRADWQSAIFNILGIEKKKQEEEFGFLLQAMKYGCPPHGGIALGLDRLIMLMQNTKSIRDVIAFPKTQTAQCPLTQAPSLVTSQQLRELSIKIVAD